MSLVTTLIASPLAFAQGSFTAGQALWDASGCAGCHDFLGATGLQAVRDQISQRQTPQAGLNYTKALAALNAALSGTDLDNDPTGMDAMFMFNQTQIADLATYLSNLPNPTPILAFSPAIGPVFPPTAAGATESTTVTVTNTGTAPLVFAVNGAAQIGQGPFADDYSVTAAQCQGMTLPPAAGDCTVTVQFRPNPGSTTARIASLALITTTGSSPTLVPLFGTLATPASQPPAGTPPAQNPAPNAAANAPSGGGALPWHLLGLLALALIAGVRGRR